jgi:hypothetical protein
MLAGDQTMLLTQVSFLWDAFFWKMLFCQSLYGAMITMATCYFTPHGILYQ